MKIVAGKNKGRKLKHLKDLFVRATSHKVREALFDIIMPYICEKVFLDVFAGTGAVGIEALSRGAGKAVFLEKNGKCIKTIYENLMLTGNRSQAFVFKKDYVAGLRMLERKDFSFDYIFLDPPYNKGFAGKALSEISDLSLLNREGQVIVQHHKREILDETIGKLKLIKQKKYSASLLSFYKLVCGNE